jgi:hypothetical protein
MCSVCIVFPFACAVQHVHRVLEGSFHVYSLFPGRLGTEEDGNSDDRLFCFRSR